MWIRQCDGVRPFCQACVKRYISGCAYETERPDQSRLAAFRLQKERLESEVQIYQDVLESLRSLPEDEANALVLRIRSGLDISSIHHDLKARSIGHQPTFLTQSSPSIPEHSLGNSPSMSSRMSPSFSPTRSRILGGTNTHDTLLSHNSPSGRNSDASDGVGYSANTSLGQGLPLPQKNADGAIKWIRSQYFELRRGLSVFVQRSEKMFPLPEREMTASLVAVCSGKNAPDTATLCEILALAAVCSKYMHPPVEPGLSQRLYRVAKSLWPDVVTRSCKTSCRVSFLLAMYCLCEKNAVDASTYIGECRLMRHGWRSPSRPYFVK